MTFGCDPSREPAGEHGDGEQGRAGPDRAEHGRVDRDVVGAVGDRDPRDGEQPAGRDGRVVAVLRADRRDQAAHPERERDEAEEADVVVGDDRQPERGEDRDGDEGGDAEVLPGPDLPGARASSRTRG